MGRIIREVYTFVNLLQVLFVDVKLRLLNDVAILWQSVVNSLQHFTIGLVSRPGCLQPAVIQYDFTRYAKKQSLN